MQLFVFCNICCFFFIFQDESEELSQHSEPDVFRSTPKKRSRRKVFVEWTDENILKLIGAVELEECLWNAGNCDYKNKIKRMCLWRDISERDFSGNYSADDLLAKWTNIRIQFKTQVSKNKMTKSGQGTEAKREWKFYQAMKFIEQAEKEQRSTTISNLVRFFFFQFEMFFHVIFFHSGFFGRWAFSK